MFLRPSVLTLLVAGAVARTGHCESRLYVDLDYRSDASLSGCPDQSEFRALIEKQLGYDPFTSGSQHKIVARAQAAGTGIRGLVRWSDASGEVRGERNLSSATTDCSAFARAMGFAIAVQIQLLSGEEEKPEAALREPTAKEQPEHDPAESSVDAAAPKRADAPDDTQRVDRKRAARDRQSGTSGGEARMPSSANAARWLFLVGAGPTLDFGVSPEMAFGGRLFAAARRGAWGAELGAQANLPAQYTTSENEGFQQRLAWASLAGCGFVGSFAGCVVNRWGRMGVRGEGVDAPNSTAGAIVQLGPRVAWLEHVGPDWVAALRLELLAALTPWRVTVNDREVWNTPFLSVSIGAELAAVFRDKP